MSPADSAPMHVESSALPSERRPSRFTLRAGGGFGAGSEGIAAAAFAAADVWPWARWGLGIEGSLGGTSSMALFGPTRTGSLIAARLRFAGRLVLARGSYFSAALGVGLAQQITVHESGSDSSCEPTFENDCATSYAPEPANPDPGAYREAIVPTGALELAYQGRIAGPIELGLVLRGEVGPAAGFVTLGPLLGVGF